MIENFRALMYTAIGAVLTALIGYSLTYIGSRDSSLTAYYESFEFSMPAIGADSNHSEKLRESINAIYSTDIRKGSLYFLDYPGDYVFAKAEIFNLSKKRIDNIEIKSGSPFFIRIAGGELDTADSRVLIGRGVKQTKIKSIDPESSVEIFAAYETRLLRGNQIRVIANGSLLDFSVRKDRDDLFGFVSLARQFPFLVLLSFISLILILVLIPLVIYIQYWEKKIMNNPKLYYKLYNRDTINKYRNIIKFIDGEI